MALPPQTMLKHDFSARYSFKDWPNEDIPPVAAGVYLIWDGEDLIYVGMSGRQIEKNLHKRRYGLYNRLQAHSSGRLSGDQFCVYVANRLVIPNLTQEQLGQFRDDDINLDMLTKEYVQQLDYQFCVVDSSKEAFSLEEACKQGAFEGRVPLLNPSLA
jgi:hypothetical protein